jgi:hypothetical protein
MGNNELFRGGITILPLPVNREGSKSPLKRGDLGVCLILSKFFVLEIL